MAGVNRIKLRQVLAASSAGMLLTGMMCSWGFPAAALPQMEKPNSNIHFTHEQASWFATITLMMAIPGSLVGATAYEWGGPRRLLLALSPLLCASMMLMSVASWKSVYDAEASETLLLCCRVVQSVLIALIHPLIPVYIYEVSDQRLRGLMTTNLEIWATLGFLLCYISGVFLSWSTIAWLLPIVTLIPAFLGILVSPDSPLWTARRGREEDAIEILTLVRSTSEEVKADLSSVQRKIEKTEPSCSESLRQASKKSNFKSIIGSCSVLVAKELGGYAVLSIYVVYIFEQAGVGMDPKWSSVMIGVTRIFCNCFAFILMHNFPRRKILIIGNALTAISTFAIGIFFFLQSRGDDVSWLSWLPLVGLTIHMIGAAGCIGPCTWTVAVEVLPGPVRSFGFGIANTSYATTAFLISKVLIDLQGLVGMQGVFWLFSGGSFGYILLALFYIPETYGRSLKDIEDYWENSKKRKDSDNVA